MAETVRIEIPIEMLDNTEPGMTNIIENIEGLGQEAKKTQTQVSNTGKAVTQLEHTSQSAQTQVVNTGKAVVQLGQSAQNTQSQITGADKAVTRFDRSAEKTQKSLTKWAKEKYQVLLEAKNKVSPILKTVKSSLKTIAGKTWNVTLKAIDFVTSPVRGIMKLLAKPIVIMASIAGIGLGASDIINTYKDFEKEIANVKAITGATSDEIQEMEDGIRKVALKSNKDISEIAGNAKMLAESGGDINLMLEQLTHGTNLATATQTDLAITLDFLGSTMKTFGIEAENTQSVVDSFAYVTRLANVELSQLGESYVNVGGSAAKAGLSIDDVNAMLVTLSNAGMKGGAAGTSLNTLLSNLKAPTDKAAKSLKSLGISLYDASGKSRDMFDIMFELEKKLGSMSDKKRNSYLSDIFDTVALKGWNYLVADGIDTIRDLSKELSEAGNDFNGIGTAAGMAEIQLDTVSGAFSLLQGAANEFKITLGEKAAPYIKQFATWLRDKIPQATDVAIKAFDWFEEKIIGVTKKIKTMTSSAEWQNADFFGKVKIAWDEIIANPFSEWWDSKGHDLIVGKAGSIGRGIGKAVSTGLLALLGVDISGAIGEGESVGSAFAKGLIAGFDMDALKEKIWDGIKGIFSNAAKILPGGEKADLTSWISAALIAKIGIPIISTVFKGAKVGGNLLFGSSASTGGSAVGSAAAGGLLSRGLLGSASTATGSLVGTGLIGTAAKVGSMLGSTAYTGAGLALAGGGAIAGGIAGGAALISGVKDLYKGFNSENKDEAAAYKEAGAWKVGGVAAGASIGTLILPGIGTLIGAGIGGVAGWLQGDKAKKKYEENLKAAQEAAEALALAEEQAKYESQELKDALADSSMTAEEFGLKFQKVVAENIKSHFGDIKLSMKEIQAISKELVYADNYNEITRFAEACNQAERSLNNMQAVVSSIKKLNWKASLGLKLNESDQDIFTTEIENLILSAKQYVEDKHYEAQLAFDLLLGDNNSIDMTSGLNETYSALQKELDDKGVELKAEVVIALDDGVIDPKELEKIMDLQDQITGITKRISDAEVEAGFETLKIKFSDIDLDSYVDFQAELQKQAESMTQKYDDALLTSTMNLRLKFSDSNGVIIDEEGYNEELNKLALSYETQMAGLMDRMENMQLEAIAKSYADKLDGILPGVTGTTADKLKAGLHGAIAEQPNIDLWDTKLVSSWLGLEELSEEAQAEIATIMQGVASTIPKSMKDTITESVLSEGYKAFGEINTALGTIFGKGVKTTMPVTVTAEYKLANPSSLSYFNRNHSGGGGYINMGIASNANGNIVTSPIISQIGEDGPEAIIPLGNKRRSRGLSLWQKAGEMLGVTKYANGGIVGRTAYSTAAYGTGKPINNTGLKYINEAISKAPRGYNEFSKQDMIDDVPIRNAVYSKESGLVEGKAPEINVQVQMPTTFEINAGNGDDENIIRIIKSHMKELADDLGGEIAKNLNKAFANMPLKEA